MKKKIQLIFLLSLFVDIAYPQLQGWVSYQMITQFGSKAPKIDTTVLYFTSSVGLFVIDPQIKKVSTIKEEQALANWTIKNTITERSRPFYKFHWEEKVYEAILNENPQDNYYLLDKLPGFGWTITSEVRQIGGYECVKAVSQTFRGRVYEAWFTYLIPVGQGPWKLGGLPGLILEAQDQTGEVRFVFQGLKLPYPDKVDYTLPPNLQLKSMEEHLDLELKELKDTIKFLKSLGADIKANITANKGLEAFPEIEAYFAELTKEIEKK
ncbi:MAG: GLPGLI family protein [Microscillaceae bacterium]|nr:GLPGLI family protein [Microscillaceae bacterium]